MLLSSYSKSSKFITKTLIIEEVYHENIRIRITHLSHNWFNPILYELHDQPNEFHNALVCLAISNWNYMDYN